MTDVIRIQPLDPGDAPKLSACFRRVYGESYVAGFFYDPAEIRARTGDGRLHSVVALTPAGEIVGHMALYRPHPRALTVELGNTIVDPRWRNQGLAARLAAALIDVSRRLGAVGFHHYPTTAHPIMQRLAVQAGGVETGVMLAYIPEGTEYRDLGGASEQGRLAVVTVYQPLDPAPAREVFLPPRYAPMLRAIHERAGLEREALAPPEVSRGVSSSTRMSSRLDDRRGLLRIHVDRAGRDVLARVREAMGAGPVEATHVDLLLSDPGAPRAVEALRTRGFFFCALLPEFAATDVLRLQHLRETVGTGTPPDLVHPEAREILRAALADREAAGIETLAAGPPGPPVEGSGEREDPAKGPTD
jgi:serine/threonine-protein kinase RsbW